MAFSQSRMFRHGCRVPDSIDCAVFVDARVDDLARSHGGPRSVWKDVSNAAPVERPVAFRVTSMWGAMPLRTASKMNAPFSRIHSASRLEQKVTRMELSSPDTRWPRRCHGVRKCHDAGAGRGIHFDPIRPDATAGRPAEAVIRSSRPRPRGSR